MTKTVTPIHLVLFIPRLATNVGCMFAECPGIKAVTLPDSLEYLDLGVYSPSFDPSVELGPPTHPLVAQKEEDEGDNED